MKYEAKNYDHLLGTAGFSDNALKLHFTLYQGYVINTNKLLDTFSMLGKEGKTGTPEFAELKRRFGWEFNGMRLHEYYFGAMKKGGSEVDMNSKLVAKMKEDFGSFDAWLAEFKATALSRGIGWSILYYDQLERRLLNPWVNEQDQGHLSGAAPILNIDVFEHAFMLDYGTKRADYFEAFMKAVDWEVVQKRFENATK
ncbi:MAG TPA: Fe-Mn family superoxide dismutase [Candidatus Norongarragalinales archaeon]|nr:Fe-Mn family superoxide dismutase [Candidatus Norongarragalinales archaeon]